MLHEPFGWSPPQAVPLDGLGAVAAMRRPCAILRHSLIDNDSMKIEIGESLGCSYLRHVKQCWLVQANWKTSEHWTRHKTLAELEAMFLDIRQKFDKDGNVFKQTNDAAQFLKQGEIDIVGMDQKGRIHAMEIAYHEAGLNYGGGADNRVLKKLLRTPASCITFLSEQAFAPQNTRFWSRRRVWFQFPVGEDKPPMLSVDNRGKGVLSMDCSAKRSPL